jgi:subtilisin family serine protease
MKAIFALFVLFAVVAVQSRATLHIVDADRQVPDSYIVVLHNNVSASLKESHIARLTGADFAITNTYTIINGYAAKITSRAALESILVDPMVDYVEPDQVFTIVSDPEPLDTVTTQNLGTQAAGLWGINRIWQRTRQITTTYQYWTTAGFGVDAYILDTGLLATHTEFSGRLATGATFVTDNNFPGTTDGNGHGTHVGSTTAGTVYGVAKRATLIAVKVLTSGGSGTTAGVVNGVDWTVTSYRSRNRPSVANMSLGGGASTALDNAVNNAVTAGVFFAVAAGNENQNACNVSPARATGAYTIGSTTNTDARSSFSNFGTCVNIFAPGSNVLGAWIGSATATNTISGTSMASPHAAGAAALFLGHLEGAPSNPTAIRNALNSRGTSGVVGGPGTGSPNLLLYTSTTE